MIIGAISSSKKTIPVFQIDNIQASFKNYYRLGNPINITANPSRNNITSWRWEVSDYLTSQLVDISYSQNPSFTNVNKIGFYDIKLIAKNAGDTFEQYYEQAFFLSFPTIAEQDCDIVWDVSTGSYFNNFNKEDNSTLVIGVKGNGTAQFQPYHLQGRAPDGGQYYNKHVLIRMLEHVNLTTPPGTAHAIWLNGDTQYVLFDGYLEDGTSGIHVQGIDPVTAQNFMIKDGGFTDITVIGVESTQNIAPLAPLDPGAAAFSAIPSSTASLNATNHRANNMHFFGLISHAAKDEGIYLGYNNDSPVGGYQPFKFKTVSIGRCIFLNSRRDAIQLGGCIDANVHDNFIDTIGTSQIASQESFISWNGGNSGFCKKNYCINGKMFLNIQSGRSPWDVFAGETTPRQSYFIGNVFINGTYPADFANEPFNIYAQTSTNSGGGVYNLTIIHNTCIGDKKFMEEFMASNSFTSNGNVIANNNIVKVGNAGDTPEVNFTGPGAQPTGFTIKNLVREPGQIADFKFTNVGQGDVTISTFTSPSYATDTYNIATIPGLTAKHRYDLLGHPLLVPYGVGSYYTYGAYSGYEKREILPVSGDPNPATFTTPVTVTSIVDKGGTLGYESNKIGLLYYIISTVDSAPTKAQIRAGKNHLGSNPALAGQLIDLGTVTSYPFRGLIPGTNYYLFCVFVTLDNVEQASVTRVAFTTIADIIAPVLSNFRVLNSNPNRLYFDSSEEIVGSTVTGITVSSPTISVTGLVINVGSTINHYFTLGSNLVYGRTPTISNAGGNNIADLYSNALANFSNIAISNFVQAKPEEKVIPTTITNVTISDNTFTCNSTSGSCRSTQIIPADSDGYIYFEWDTNSRSSSAQCRIGLIGSADSLSIANLRCALDIRSDNGNIDVFNGTNPPLGGYRATYGGISAANHQYRFRVVRNLSDSTQDKIYFDYRTTSTGVWIQRHDFGNIGQGALRFGAVFAALNKIAKNCWIEAASGLQ